MKATENKIRTEEETPEERIARLAKEDYYEEIRRECIEDARKTAYLGPHYNYDNDEEEDEEYYNED